MEHGAPAVMPGFEGGDGGGWISGPGGGVKRVQLDTKLSHFVRHGILWIQTRPRVWKRLRVQDHSGHKARRVHQDDGAHVPVQNRLCMNFK